MVEARHLCLCHDASGAACKPPTQLGELSGIPNSGGMGPAPAAAAIVQRLALGSRGHLPVRARGRLRHTIVWLPTAAVGLRLQPGAHVCKLSSLAPI